uniref:Uncharacterized protein n=1 Tax=uncultured gamma proteobacterium HF0010_01E20 TaxID=710977 RepID=E0XQ74_9GAMM|nr:hypothetical protein [uncultured gamma proteobacterium HF0010_01E20]
MAEQRSPKPQVGGSIPSWPAILLARLVRRRRNKQITELSLVIKGPSLENRFDYQRRKQGRISRLAKMANCCIPTIGGHFRELVLPR